MTRSVHSCLLFFRIVVAENELKCKNYPSNGSVFSNKME